jgi:hypothetical protein
MDEKSKPLVGEAGWVTIEALREFIGRPTPGRIAEALGVDPISVTSRPDGSGEAWDVGFTLTLTQLLAFRDLVGAEEVTITVVASDPACGTWGVAGIEWWPRRATDGE